ncbi:MAG: hypothetical protein GXP55_24295, partial [Deltaproteobacteria bacterium]|nr:hypothetical protein [Deltaproteobacteria bacterium]
AQQPIPATTDDHERLAQLVLECREDPGRVEALLELHQLAGSLGRSALRHVTAEILSLFHPDVAAPRLTRGVADQLVDPLALVAEQTELHADLLSALWEGALPLFRRPLRSFGVLGTQKVSPLAARPLGAAFADGLRLLGPLEVTLYARPSSRREILIAPTHPPAVLVADSLEDDSDHLRFRLGVALDAARPAAVVLASSPANTGRMILEAAHAAFGPASARGETARDVAALAADLWRTVPNRQQATLRRAVASLDGPPDYDLAQRQSLARGARAGLLLCESLATSLRTLPLVDDDLLGVALESAESYTDLVGRSLAARAVLHMALSDRWLVALERQLES